MKNKHEIMQDYLQPIVSEILGKYLYFNILNPDSVTFTANAAEEPYKLYIDGTKDTSYGFSVIACFPYSEYRDNANVDAWGMLDEFITALDEKNNAGDFPVFEGCSVYEISANQNIASFSGTDEETKEAKYMFAATVKYLEK